ncbi:isoamylase 2, chloroplastic-like [Malus sylvestris]|uniref:isoamylase 2, chloroplastic-like n=1 Tax=Malus sylvestris TaxID=3752 RepID=UPI0021AC4D31|nr:isoamylase 2, chloroplastic-like [Malus sylvestris]
MATLPLSIAIQASCCLNCGTTELPKLTATDRYGHRNNGVHGYVKLGTERNLVLREVVQILKERPLRDREWKVYATSRVSVEPVEQRVSTGTETEEVGKVSTYLFRTDTGDPVNVFVRKRNAKYAVNIEVSLLHLSRSDRRLVLSWGMYRADSSSFVPSNFRSSTPADRTTALETPFTGTSSGKFTLELEFEAKQIPFYLSFVLKSPADADLSDLEIRSHRKTNFCFPVGFGRGCPAPLGVSFSNDGSMNFAIFSRNAESVVLCLYAETTAEKPVLELDLDPYVNRSGDIWHASFENAWDFVSYGYRFDEGNVLLDPYAKIIAKSVPHGTGSKYLGRLCEEPAFEWAGDVRPDLTLEKLVVYRLNVKRFTKHKSSKLPTNIAGTFSGLTEKLEHFKALGVNAVLLEPIFPFDEQKGPYFPVHFFSPMNCFGPPRGPVSAVISMKEMVKFFHADGIEVLLEVVFTHTSEGEAMQGIDISSYYHVNGVEDLEARNALNCNYPVVQQMVLDSLRYWVTEFHVDGFCFINASSLLRGSNGEYLSRPPLVEAIAFDPLLSKTKIIADCWDPRGLVPKETRFPHWKRWAEVNTKFSNDVRNFLRGEGLLSDLATRLCGNGDIFSDGRGPASSFNFISRNSGLSLVDLVSFSGVELAAELSCNCGEEGPTNKTAVLERRLKQIRNFLFILFVSLGVPVLNMGDEYGQSAGGSPAYSDRKAFDWNALGTGFATQTTQFIAFLSSFRIRRSDLLQKRNFLKEENIDWYGSDQSSPKWEDPSSKFLAMKLKADEEEAYKSADDSSLSWGDLFVAFSAADLSETVILPPLPEGMGWFRLVDTALPFPGFFSTDGEPVAEQPAGLFAYEMKSHSCALFEARSL